MLSSLKYSNGKVTKGGFTSLGVNGISWIDLYNPTEKEFKQVSKATGIYIPDLERSLKKTELPVCMDRDKYSMLVLRALNPKGGYSPFGVYITKKYIVTVHQRKILTIKELFDSMQKDQGKEFFSKGLVYIFLRIFSQVTKRFQEEIDKIEDDVDNLEDAIIDGNVKSPQKIFDLKSDLMSIRKSLTNNRDLLDITTGRNYKYIPHKNPDWYSDAKLEVNQIVSISEMVRERLTGSMDIYMSSVSNRLNDIMKSFTVIASLLLLPMLVSGIWGMNFANIPFYNEPKGFFIPIIIMLSSMFLMLMWFKSKKWM